MRTDRGFRIPEPRERIIQWPARKPGDDPVLAVYRPSIRAWSIPGVERAYGSPDEIVRIYGNDWVEMYLDVMPEAAK